MAENHLDNVQYKLLGLLQTGFPQVKEPYESIGLELGVSGEEVIRRIESLKEDEIVRQISPVIDARSLGYQSTLIAIKVPCEKMGAAERYLKRHPGVSHGYERDHEFNIWITLSVPPGEDLKRELQRIRSRTCADAMFALPATKVFKLRTNFGLDDGGNGEDDVGGGTRLAREVRLSDLDRRIINELQQDLPLRADPFGPLAERLDISTAALLKRCSSLKRRGVIRRYGASINHYKAGYRANAMTCWRAPKDRVTEVGKRLASVKQVSHCYERATNSYWTYNLFAMIHGSSKKACQDIVREIAADTGLADYLVLFSTKEFKKIRVMYRV